MTGETSGSARAYMSLPASNAHKNMGLR